jgi:hypothetical protein
MRFKAYALCVGIGPDTFYPGKMLLDSIEDPYQSLLWNNQGVPIHEEDAVLPFQML